jgi:uncharacterized OB-fold protein
MVVYGRCPTCEHLMLPVLDRSPCGHGVNPVVAELTETGTVYSWTIFRLAESPRVIAMADFFGGDLRVTAPLLGATEVAIGDSVVVTQGEGTPYALRRA